MKHSLNNCSIYIACLASHNEGILHGKWVDVTDPNQIRDEINDVLQSSPIPKAEKYAIHNYDGFDSIRLSEHEDIRHICEIAELINEHGELIAHLYNKHQDIESIKTALDEQYTGCYDSPKDFVCDIMNELHNIPENLSYYIDYDKYLRDMKVNDINIYEVGNKFHIFYQH